MIRCIKFANSPLERIGLLICLVDYKIHRDTSDCPQTHPYASLSAPRPTCQTNAVYCLNTVSSVWESCFTSLWLYSCPVVSDSLRPMDCSTPGLPVPHHLPIKFPNLIFPRRNNESINHTTLNYMCRKWWKHKLYRPGNSYVNYNQYGYLNFKG